MTYQLIEQIATPIDPIADDGRRRAIAEENISGITQEQCRFSVAVRCRNAVMRLLPRFPPPSRACSCGLFLDVSDLRFSRCNGSAKVFNLLCLSF